MIKQIIYMAAGACVFPSVVWLYGGLIPNHRCPELLGFVIATIMTAACGFILAKMEQL